MKHKLYESWILDEAPLTAAQQKTLEQHLQVCESCKALQMGWAASKKLISQAALHKPAVGFADRWQQTVIKKCQIEKVRRYRLSVFSLILLAFAGTMAYMIISGSLLTSFANGVAIVSNLFMTLTNGISTIGFWFNELPIAVPITAGVFSLGLFSAFMMAGMFFLLGLRKRKLQTNEIEAD